ncbi:MAM and LDL-receptor class A domain-containing protein 2-like [Antedon mediterranea]|uniref:MAM and LDL-receptor class A domain-containing protein 2-like n=1 Tax=Antedon mediterranea TaxID=105859 RepID=UPI003AF56F50
MSFTSRQVLLMICMCSTGVLTRAQVDLCSFNSNLCGFTNDANNNIDWQRIQNGTTSDYFLSLSTTSTSSDKTGRITSQTLAPSSTSLCLEFFYSSRNTTGNAPVFKVYYKKASGASTEEMVWQTNNSTENNVKHFLVDFTNVTEDYKIVFEGKLLRNSNARITVDNVKMLNGSCFRKFICDFEGTSFCMIQDTGDTADFDLNRGYTASYGTGPSADHTLGTAQGHYAYLETSYYGYYDKYARMKTPLQRTSSEVNDMCLIFWYHMWGVHIDKLSVYIRRYGESNEVELFTKTGNGGRVWKTAHIPINEENNFKIIFEANKGNGYRGDIAVDDITISYEKCLIDFQCDFDHEACYEQNTDDDKDWSIGRYWNPDTYYTVGDHTSSTRYSGKYAFLDAQYLRENKIATISTLLLTSSSEDEKFCLKFWYIVSGTSQMSVFIANSESTNILWKQHITKNDDTIVWREGEITYTPDENYKISFQGKGGLEGQGFIAIDDIKIHNEPCVNKEVFNCTFEGDNFCGLQKGASTDNYIWSLHSRADTYNAGPFFDHTHGDENGHYAFVDTHDYNSINDTAVILTPVLHNSDTNSSKCLIFWYHMYGLHIETLDVFLLTMQDNLPGRKIWSKSGSRGNVWRAAEVELSEENSFQVVFRSIRGSGLDGDIGVDDIVIRNGSCRNTGEKEDIGVSCKFEETHICGYTQAMDNDFPWTWTNSALGSKHEAPGIPTIDHTKNTGLGFFMFADFRESIMIRQSSRLISPFNDDTSKQCLEFWHFIYGTTSQELRVLLNQSNTIEVIYSIKGSRGAYWQRSAIEITPTVKNQIVFEAKSGLYPTGAVTIDDVSMYRGNCKAASPTTTPKIKTVTNVDCNFESDDLCGYIQAIDDDYDWTLQSPAIMKKYYSNIWWYRWWGVGHEWYPLSDRTDPHSDKGYFLYNEVPFYWYQWWYDIGNTNGLVARLMSPLIEQSETSTCLTFWYYKQQEESDFLNVYVLPYNQVLYGDPLVDYFGGYGSRWIFQKIDIPASDHFQIIFEVTNGAWHYTSSFIDEIKYTRSPCDDEDMKCDFEKGFTDCELAADPSSKYGFKWQLSRGNTATKDTGPSVDHTCRDNNGVYIYIDASQPQRPGDTATVATHYWKQYNKDTCLTFWYYCNNSFADSLVVHSHSKNRKTVLWKMPRVFESDWKEVRKQLSPQNASYQIVFTGTVGESKLGDIALDDISLSSTPCFEQSSLLPPPPEAIPNTTSLPVKSYDCAADKGKCTITQLYSDQFNWLYSEYDSSYMCSSKNRYIGQKAQLKTPQFVKENRQCLTITYKTTGVSVPILSVLRVESKSKIQRLWKSDTIADEWTTALVSIDKSPTSYSILIEAMVTESGNGTVFIQTINMSSGKCPNLSSSQVALIVVIILVLVALVAISLVLYRYRTALRSFNINVRHQTLSEDVSIGKVQNDKSPIVDP